MKVKEKIISAYLVFFLAGLAIPANAALLEGNTAKTEVTAKNHLIFSSEYEQGDATIPMTQFFMHEVLVQTQYKQYSLAVQFANQLTELTESDRYHPLVLEKKSAQAEWKNLKLILGDSHQEFGRGIALSLYSDPTFGIDNTLEGAAIQYSPSGWDLTLLAGRINALTAPVALYAEENPVRQRDVWLLGTSIEYKLSQQLKAGTHYLLALNKPYDKVSFDRRWHTIGASFAKNGLQDSWDFYLESNALLTRRLGNQSEDLPMGHGTYASLVWSPVPWQLKLEAKDYRNYHFEFQRPPTLEDDVVETINTQDTSAARFAIEHHFIKKGASISGSYLVGNDREQESSIHHGVVGTKFRGPLSSKIELAFGYRYLPQKANLTHGSLKTKIPTFKHQSLELEFKKRLDRTNLDFYPMTEDRNTAGITYSFSGKFNLSTGLEYLPTNSDEIGKYFASLGAEVKMGALTAKAFVGQTSGGTVCSGGVCKRMPPYNGGMLESTYSF